MSWVSSQRVPRLLLAFVFILLCTCKSNDPEPAAIKPNMVLVVIDALRASNVSFLGYSRQTTPHLDTLASESYIFDHAISIGGNTPTVMSGIMTGHYPFFSFEEEWSPTSFGMRRFYTTNDESGIPHGLPTLAELLKSAGYSTAGFVTNPYLKKEFNFHRGFDHYEEIFRAKGIPYGRGESVSLAVTKLLDLGIREPFFLYLHYMDVHGPYYPPAPYRSKFNALGKDLDAQSFQPLWRRWEKEMDASAPDADTIRGQMMELYDGSINYVDACIEQVIRKLKEMGLMENTVIVLTADHGDEFLEHCGTTHKGTLYDELVRVPLLIRVPRRDGGRIHSLVRNFDLMPTLLHFAGIDIRPELNAVSLSPFIDGEERPPRLIAYAGFPSIRMLRTTHYKLLHFRTGRKELYDLEEDPGERSNLYAMDSKYAESMSRMDEAMARLVESLAAIHSSATPTQEETDQVTRDQLRALGYLD